MFRERCALLLLALAPLWALVLTPLLIAAKAGADPAAAEPIVSSHALPAVAAIAPPEKPAGDVDPLWSQSEELEAAGDYLTAAALRERLVRDRPGDVHLHWRIARDMLHHSERTPGIEVEERVVGCEMAQEWARRGRALDPSCGECCLYEFAATGRLASLQGLMGSLGAVREAGRLAEECLADPPTWRDARSDERANLYYAAAVYYRLVPDAVWLRWLAGVRGDAARAAELAERASELVPGDLNFRTELGAALLCDATRRDDAGDLARAHDVLSGVLRSEDPAADPHRDRARRLLADPAGACQQSNHGPVAWH